MWNPQKSQDGMFSLLLLAWAPCPKRTNALLSFLLAQVKFISLTHLSSWGSLNSSPKQCIKARTHHSAEEERQEDLPSQKLLSYYNIKLPQCWRWRFQGHRFRIPCAHFHPPMELVYFTTEGRNLELRLRSKADGAGPSYLALTETTSKNILKNKNVIICFAFTW